MNDSLGNAKSAATGGLLRVRLSLQHFLQFAIWGSWGPVLVKHLQNIGFDGTERAAIMSVSPLAFMLSPLLAGQIADRWMPTQRMLSILYLLGGMSFMGASRIDQATDFWPMWGWVFLAMFFFAPTLGLGNAISFHHLLHPAAEFPAVRVGGTLGWIAGTFFYGAYMMIFDMDLRACLEASALLAFVNSLYCLTLPHTPPIFNAGTGERFALTGVLKLFRDPSFCYYCFSSFLLMVGVAFYYFKSGEFFPTLGIPDRWLGGVQSIGQASEILTMLLLPFFLKRFGFKRVMALGILAWSIRFGICSHGRPTGLVIASLALHGLCFSFVSTAGSIYLNQICAADARASAQSFFAWITAGVGLFIGAHVGGLAGEHYTLSDASIDWPAVWAAPMIISAVALGIFLAGFRARVRADGSVPGG